MYTDAIRSMMTYIFYCILLQTNQIYNLVWSSGLNVYNLYAECAGGAQNLNLHFDASKGKYVTSNFGWPFMFLKNTAAELKAVSNSIVSFIKDILHYISACFRQEWRTT